MGLFGGKKTYVSSVCYNLAGPEVDRPDYLKTMVVSNVIGAPPNSSIADAIKTGFENGPTTKLRNFYRWSQSHYNGVIGLSSSGLAGAPNIDPAVVAANMGVGGTVVMQMVRSNLSDFEVWAEQWMLVNNPTLFNTAWTSDYDDVTNEVVVTLASLAVHRFTPANFVKTALYIYASYTEVTETAAGTTVPGTPVSLAPGVPFPSTAGWTGSNPYVKTDFMGSDGLGRVFSREYTMTFTGTVPGVHDYTIDEKDVLIKAWSTPKIFIYKVGSGVAALDSLIVTSSVGGFFPPIPVRINNAFLSSSFMNTEYIASKKAYSKLTGGGKFDDLVVSLTDNPNLADIDYAFVVPGVSLNAVDNSARRYLYEFFAATMLTDAYGEANYATWTSGISGATSSAIGFQNWFDAQGSVGNPLNGTAEPGLTPYASGARNEIRMRSTNAALGYDTRVAWKAIKLDTGSGLSRAGAKIGDVWLAKGSAVQEAGTTFGGSLGSLGQTGNQSEDLLIWYQDGASSWRRLTIRGLVHQNYIYKGKYVEIKAHEAMDDADESGFIVPIHYDTWRNLSIRHTTQMATASTFIVLNSYLVKKQRWYQTGIFKIVLFIVIIIVMILAFGLPTAGIPGLLGTATSVGAALGLTGTVALIVGSLANLLAAAIVGKILMAGATELFGEKIGLIVALVLTFLTLNIGTSLATGATLSTAITQMANPLTLLSLTNSIGEGISGIITLGIQDTLAKTQEVMASANQQSLAISRLYEQNIGYGSGVIDPTMLLSSNQWYVESGETFLARTLMTGSDLVGLTESFISRFSELTLSTELPV